MHVSDIIICLKGVHFWAFNIGSSLTTHSLIYSSIKVHLEKVWKNRKHEARRKIEKISTK